MDTIWNENPSNSEVSGPRGGDKKRMTKQNRHSRFIYSGKIFKVTL